MLLLTLEGLQEELMIGLELLQAIVRLHLGAGEIGLGMRIRVLLPWPAGVSHPTIFFGGASGCFALFCLVIFFFFFKRSVFCLALDVPAQGCYKTLR